MPTPAHVDPSAFDLDGGATGVLLIHGLTGSPAEVRPMGEALHARGLHVVGPQLPGHGTRVEDLRPVPFTAWIEHASAALDDLRARCDRVIVGALSMGALVAAHLAIRDDVDGVFVMAPALAINAPPLWTAAGLKHIWRFANKPPATDTHLDDEVWCYDRIPLASLHELWRLQRAAAQRLPDVRAPALVMGGRLDASVPASAVERYFALLGSADKALQWFEKSGHIVPLDVERDRVFDRVAAFVDHASGTTSTRASGLST